LGGRFEYYCGSRRYFTPAQRAGLSGTEVEKFAHGEQEVKRPCTERQAWPAVSTLHNVIIVTGGTTVL